MQTSASAWLPMPQEARNPLGRAEIRHLLMAAGVCSVTPTRTAARRAPTHRTAWVRNSRSLFAPWDGILHATGSASPDAEPSSSKGEVCPCDGAVCVVSGSVPLLSVVIGEPDRGTDNPVNQPPASTTVVRLARTHLDGFGSAHLSPRSNPPHAEPGVGLPVLAEDANRGFGAGNREGRLRHRHPWVLRSGSETRLPTHCQASIPVRPHRGCVA